MEAVADDFDVAGGAERFAQQAVRFVVVADHGKCRFAITENVGSA
jgi:hypothetical protein